MDTSTAAPSRITVSPTSILTPLVLAQFVCAYAASNMNVAISDIARDLHTTVSAIQAVITIFTLTMAALMIPGSKLTDIWGRKRCFMIGLAVYGIGALIAALTPTLTLLFVGYSLLEGIGTALLIPPVYILITVVFTDLPSRAKSFGMVSAAAGIGAAAGPLIGGLITSAISWRASFIFQVLIVAGIMVLGRKIVDAGVQGAKPHFDMTGAVLSAVGLVFIVVGILQTGTYGWLTTSQAFTIGGLVVIPAGGISPMWIFVAIGVIFLLAFFHHIGAMERAGKTPLVASRIFRNRVANLGLVTQNIQWLIMQGSFFVISVYLQTIRGYSAIQTGLSLTPAIIGVLLSSSLAGRFAKKRPQKLLIEVGFAATILGILLILLLSTVTTSTLGLIPGLLLMGLGIGVMLTSSVNVVQSSFSEKDQGEISGVSRSVSNLGSSLGVAIVGSVLVIDLSHNFAFSLIAMAVFGCGGLAAALLLPHSQTAPGSAPGSAPRRRGWLSRLSNNQAAPHPTPS